jgi:lipoprotein-releasing system ATP-binding protein
MTDQNQILKANDIHRRYRMGSQDLHVLQGVDVSFTRGEWVAILGASGSGKSTLLHILGALDQPSQGDVYFEQQSIFAKRQSHQDRYRNQHVGFIFQQYHLLPELNALENVVLSAMIGKGIFAWSKTRSQAKRRAEEILTKLGLADRLRHRPSKLSGGERQRVAIARALVNNPSVLLADEPTGNLDETTGEQILDVFRQLHQDGQTIVMVTHDQHVAGAADRKLQLERGKLV